MSAIGDLTPMPREFLSAMTDLRQANCRSEIRLDEIPAPSRLAPFAVALGAEVFQTGPQLMPVHGESHAAFAGTESVELATGRFILLHNPDGSDLWGGTFRIVTYIRAQLEPEMGNDSLLGSVAWTWLVEALQTHGAEHSSAGGTATRILSESYGTLTNRPDSIDIELRASWTPEGPRLRNHLEAWADMVCTFAGFPPLPDGVTSLPRQRWS